jgi:hypothetical protein
MLNSLVTITRGEVLCYRAMDPYSFEVWVLDRHQAVVSHAEARSRLQGWQPQARLAELVAAYLRQLADQLDGRRHESPSPVSPTPG